MENNTDGAKSELGESERFVQLGGPKVKTLREIVLHQYDLQTALQLLEALNSKSLSNEVRKGLWHHAITVYYKCFKHNDARRRLWPQIVYATRRNFLTTFNFFQDLRDKHIVHDDNPYIRAYVGAIINEPGKEIKVEEVISGVAVLDVLEESKWRMFSELVRYAVEWIGKERTRMQDAIKREFEEKSYDELCSLEELAIKVPTIDQVSSKKSSDE